MGTLANSGTLSSSASFSAPPVNAGQIIELLLHFPHLKELIFSTMPKMGKLTLRQKSISLRTSNNATSCGVVMITAPSMLLDKYWTIDKCSSEVPGGVSTSR